MKKYILLLIVPLLSYGQYGNKDYPGPNPEVLVGNILKVKEKSEGLQKYGYREFYSSFTPGEVNSDGDKKSVYMGSYSTDYDALVGKEFNVLSCRSIYIYKRFYLLTLFNEETDTLYFKYNSKSDSDFYFEIVGDMVYQSDVVCNKVDKEVDKFDGSETYRSEEVSGIKIIRSVDNIGDYIFMSIGNHIGAGLVSNGKGVIILLENGEKIEKPNVKIKYKSDSVGWTYSAFFSLNESDIKLLSESKITDTRLYLFDKSHGKSESTLIQEYLKCILAN